MKPSKAQRDALKWLAAHNGDGVFAGAGATLLAAGEISPFMRSTWNRLAGGGYVELYGGTPQGRKRRIRLTDLGRVEAGS